MVEIHDDGSKILLKLKAQSPLIHFQARETGATIRASEVKPKLDRFILDKLKKAKGKSEAQLAEDDQYKDIFLPMTDSDRARALRYKMQIYCEYEPTIVIIKNNRNKREEPDVVTEAYDKLKEYPLYFGNSGKSGVEQTLGVVSDPTVCIHCFNETLRGLIARYIEEFFLVTNFGTMQNKGFGSFAPADFAQNVSGSEEKKREISGYLKELTGTDICYCMTVNGGRGLDYEPYFKRIESFYHLMKSGYNNRGEYERSFLFTYMHNHGIGNEKAWMKQQGISPTVGRSARKAQHDEKSRYVRALFGTTGAIRYQGVNGAVNVTISSDDLERVPSPVLFKIVGDTVFITAFPVDEKLYQKSYSFSSKMGKGRISTPAKEDFSASIFDMSDFMAQYVAHYNGLIRGGRLPKYLNHAPEVKKL